MAKANTKPVKNAPAKAEAERVSLVAVEPIRIDGVDVQPDEPFEASPLDAEALKGSGAARDAD